MFDMEDTAFSYGRALIVCKYLQESFKVKESSLCVIWNADTVFLLTGADIVFNSYHKEFQRESELYNTLIPHTDE